MLVFRQMVFDKLYVKFTRHFFFFSAPVFITLSDNAAPTIVSSLTMHPQACQKKPFSNFHFIDRENKFESRKNVQKHSTNFATDVESAFEKKAPRCIKNMGKNSFNKLLRPDELIAITTDKLAVFYLSTLHTYLKKYIL